MLEDNPLDAELVVRKPRQGQLRATHRVVETERDFSSALADSAPHVVISDFTLPGFDGLLALQIAADVAPGTPFISIPGTIGEEHAIDALKRGAPDYLLEDDLNRLVPAIQSALRQAEIVRRRQDITNTSLAWNLCQAVSSRSGRSALATSAGRAFAYVPRAARAWLCRMAAAVLIVMLAGIPESSAQNIPRTASEESVKAAYLFKFPAYVDWPPDVFESDDTPLTIGIVDSDRLADELAAITTGRRVNGRPVETRRLSSNDEPSGVHVLFLPATRSAELPIAEEARSLPILTVGEKPDESSGAVVSFVPVDGRIRFEVDLGEAERRGLRLHSGILAVAERVRGARR